MEETEFISIVTDHRKLIYKVCRLYCPDLSKRKDLEQEILLQLWRSFKIYDGSVQLSTWIYRVSINTAISFYRNESKHSRNTLLSDNIIVDQLEPAHPDNPEIDKLLEIIHGFNALDKGLMLLYLDNYPHKVISEILGLSESNVGTKIARIKERLRNQLRTFKTY